MRSMWILHENFIDEFFMHITTHICVMTDLVGPREKPVHKTSSASRPFVH